MFFITIRGILFSDLGERSAASCSPSWQPGPWDLGLRSVVLRNKQSTLRRDLVRCPWRWMICRKVRQRLGPFFVVV